MYERNGRERETGVGFADGGEKGGVETSLKEGESKRRIRARDSRERRGGEIG